MSGFPALLGAVLAGGESRRFGRDKTREPLGGLTLVERAARTLEEVCGRVVVVSSRPIRTERPTLPDLRPPCGPLGGVEAALQEAERLRLGGAFVLACDLPLVTARTVRTVIAALGDAEAAAPLRAGTPSMEPLCAAYRTSCLAVASTLLDGGTRAAHALFARVGGVEVACPPEELLNVNERADRDRAEALLAARDA